MTTLFAKRLLTAVCLLGWLAFPCVVRAGEPSADPKSALPRPSAGVPFIQPSHKSEIIRITDESDGTNCYHSYSYWPSFNQDSTLLIVCCDDTPVVFHFDPQTLSVAGKEHLFAHNPPSGNRPSWEDAVWSALEPDIIFCREGLRLWRLDVRRGTYELAKDFSADIPPGFLAQMSRSIDDKTFAFTVQDIGWNNTGFLVWRRDVDRIVMRGDLPKEGLDEVQIDKTGRYLVIKSSDQGAGVIQARVADLESGFVRGLTDDAPDYAPGHSDNGRDLIVGADNWRNCVTVRKLSQPDQHKRVLDLHDDWSQDYHVSMLADDESHALLSFYTISPSPWPGSYRDEILLVAIDGSQEVRRLGKHHSIVRNYWDSPRANLNRDGKLAVFTSNWGGTDRRDVYVMKVSQRLDGH